MTSITNMGRVAAVSICILALGACSNMNNTEQSVLSGAMIGTAAGVAGTVITGGCVTCGAVVGGAVGAGAGYLIDQARSHDSGSTSENGK